MTGIGTCPLCGAPKRPRFLVAYIQETVADYYGISVMEMLADRRCQALSVPRHVAILLAYQLTDKSLPDIGGRFNRDHTSILHAVRSIHAKKSVNGALAAEITFLREKLLNTIPIDQQSILRRHRPVHIADKAKVEA